LLNVIVLSGIMKSDVRMIVVILSVVILSAIRQPAVRTNAITLNVALPSVAALPRSAIFGSPVAFQRSFTNDPKSATKKMLLSWFLFFLLYLEIPQSLQFLNKTYNFASFNTDVDRNDVFGHKILSRQKRNFGGMEPINFTLVSMLIKISLWTLKRLK
jgi:hypothetical protein